MIASNIANADTPGYVGRDINFKEAMNAATSQSTSPLAPSISSDGTSHPRHIALPTEYCQPGFTGLRYTAQTQPAMDGNSVDMDRERANFVDNSVRYEATLRFINGQTKTILSAIQGQ